MIDGTRQTSRPWLLSLCGPSCSGKSQLAKAVVRVLGDDVCDRIPADYFFVPRGQDESLERFLDRPMRWDWVLMDRRLSLPIGTVTSTPNVDFAEFVRFAEEGGLAFAIRSVMIVDAMALHPGADAVVRIDVPAEERARRLVERDQRWGTRVADRAAHLERSAFAAIRVESSDLVIDGTRPLAENARLLAGWIREQQA